MKPLEAVARAILRWSEYCDGEPASDEWVERYWTHAKQAKHFTNMAQTCDHCVYEDVMRQARAAITALRDAGVTEGMRAAADDVVATYPGYGDRYELDAEFRAMLDAALAD